MSSPICGETPAQTRVAIDAYSSNIAINPKPGEFFFGVNARMISQFT